MLSDFLQVVSALRAVDHIDSETFLAKAPGSADSMEVSFEVWFFRLVNNWEVEVDHHRNLNMDGFWINNMPMCACQEIFRESSCARACLCL